MTDALSDEAFGAAFAGLRGLRSPILLAVSGGPDSVALMHSAATWSRAVGGPPLAVATVDHGLRPGSRAEAEAVATAARALGLEHAILTWNPDRAGPVSQAIAREARYRLLVGHGRTLGVTHLATAHTLDDQAETLLMRLAAGSGPAGMAGMEAEVTRGGLRHVRPFLHIAKAALVATCCARGWAFAVDPSNADSRFARVRWRELTGSLAAEGLDAARLARFAKRAARVEAALRHAAEAALDRVHQRSGSGKVSIDTPPPHPEVLGEAEPRRTPNGYPCFEGPLRGPPQHEEVGEPLSRPTGVSIILNATALVREPDEIALRVLALALRSDVDGARPEPRLERLEACWSALAEAVRAGRPCRRTLAGRLLDLRPNGLLAIGPEPSRRRGRAGPVTVIAARAPHSLGREPSPP